MYINSSSKMSILKTRILILLVITTLINISLSGQRLLIDKVVAKVGSENILLSEIEDVFSYEKTRNPSISNDIKCELLESIIIQKIIVYQAKIDSVEVSEEEVAAQLDYRFDAILRQMNGDEAFFQEYYGASVQEMKDRYRDDQHQKLVAERMQSKLMSEIEITPNEVIKFFHEIPADSLPYFKSEMEVSEIVSFPKVNEVEKKRALDKITKIRQEIINGTVTFEEAAKKNSQDPGSAIKGGDLGFARRGIFVPEFEATVFSLEPNELSEIIETEFGFHIIQLLARKANSVRARHILIKPEITNADKQKTKKLLDSLRTAILDDSLTFASAVRLYSTKTFPSYANGGRMKNMSNNSAFFGADDLDPDTYFALVDLKPGQISKPIEIKMPDGQIGYRLVQLNSLTKPHQANLNDDFDKIKEYARQYKMSNYFAKWIEEKRKDIYIFLDPMFSDCNLFEN